MPDIVPSALPIISQSPFIDKHYQSSENLRLFQGQTASGGRNQGPNPALSLIPPKARVLASRWAGLQVILLASTPLVSMAGWWSDGGGGGGAGLQAPGLEGGVTSLGLWGQTAP